MTASTRAKFVCNSIEDFGMSKRVKLSCVHAPDANGEDANFTKYTPWGEATLSIDNPAASCQFEPGKFYYADFHRAPDPV